jgi:hypothetical protein
VRLDAATNTYFEDPNPSGVRAVRILARPLNDSGQQIIPRHDENGNEIGSQPPPYKPPEPYWTLAAPYKVLRQPTPASDEPYQLPEGTAIDLRASGVGVDNYFYVPGLNDNDQGILILFAPEGRVARVSYSQLPINGQENSDYDQAVVDNLYLLVGRRENVPAPAAGVDPTLQSAIQGIGTDAERAKLREPVNWLRGSGQWIVLGSQTGRIATIENASFDMAALYGQYTKSPYNVSPGTEELRNQQILAAREFTREMAQVGGR